MNLFKRWNCDHTFGEIIDTEYQYCTKCGLAVTVPSKPPCNHPKWICISEGSVENVWGGNVFKKVRVMKCEKCGKLVNFETPEPFKGNPKIW